MQQPAEDEGYEPDSAICLTQYTDPKDALTETTTEPRHSSTQRPEKPTQVTIMATKRSFPGAGADQETDASPKRRRPGGTGDDVRTADGHGSWRRTGERLPVEIWQHVFTFLSPRDLCSLLPVNRLCYGLLHPSPHPDLRVVPPVPSSPSPVVTFLDPDHVWRSSRRLTYPNMPAPLKGKSELDMWRIACGRACQFCRNRRTTANSRQVSGQTDTWRRGPGAKGVSPVFPFAVVSCGQCLVEQSVKEMELILSSVPSALHPALPAVFLTSDLHIIAPATMQRGSELSVHDKPSKVYWPAHIDQIKDEFESVRSLGGAAAEEWLKGLDARGKKALVDASRWEKFHLSGGLALLQESILSGDTPETTEPSLSSPISQSKQECRSQATSSFETNRVAVPTASSDQVIARAQEAKQTLGVIPGLSIALPRIPEDTVSSQGSKIQDQEAHGEAKKAERRAEIERRAAWLTPPITPEVLAHMASFKAAVQIPSSLDDHAWESLMPRLLAQRADAEKQADLVASKAQAAPISQEVPDKLWDEAQGPLRARLVYYADTLISKQWDDGDKVSKKTSARFAIQTLLHVRKCFYEEVERDATAARAAGKSPIIDPPEGPWTQKLTLENMKWLFDLKIRPLTEKHKKEPFFCNGCTQSKAFGLEGVIQHYAAKHDSSLSKGNVVVFWRAEWPAVSPFSPDPTRPGASLPSKTQRKAAQAQAAQQDDHAPQATVRDGVAPTGPAAGFNGCQVDVAGPRSGLPQQSGRDAIPGLHLAPAVSGHAVSSVQAKNIGQAPKGLPKGVSRKRLRGRMVEVAQRTWSIISQTQVSSSVKVAILIHHVAKTVQDEFSMSAPLDLFIECVPQLERPVPVGAVKKLKCKACHGVTNTNLNNLLTHFNCSHTTNGKKSKGKAIGDWRTDMIELPAMEELKRLPQQLTSARKAYKLAMGAMPWAFDEEADYDMEPPAAFEPVASTHRSDNFDGRKADFPRAMTKPYPLPTEGVARPFLPTGVPTGNHGRPMNAPGHPPERRSATVSQLVRSTYPQDVPMEEADDHYSPPPPEAYQTKSHSQTVEHGPAVVQPQQSAQVAEGRPRGLNQAPSFQRNEAYYHQNDRPDLRPASEVYSRSQPRPAAQEFRDPKISELSVSRRADQQRVDQSAAKGQRTRNVAQPPNQRVWPQSQYGPWSADSQHREPVPRPYGAAPPANASPRGGQSERYGRNRQRSLSPKPDGQLRYRERSPPPRLSETYSPAEPLDYHHQDRYEVIRVRDPAGDYLIRRPVPQGPYAYGYRGPAQPPIHMGHAPPPPYAEPYGVPAYFPDFQQPPPAMPYPSFPFPRATTMAPLGYGPPMAYDEYDPRDAGRMAPPPPQQRHRYGTESRF